MTAGGLPRRTRIYIDGYNLYYGCLKGTSYKWLDPVVLLEQHLLPSSTPQNLSHPVTIDLLSPAVKFFTAKILDKAAKAADSVSSQARYHTALRKLYGHRVEIIEGYYSIFEAKAKIVDRQDPAKWPKDCQDILVWKMEEKQTDVNLALHAYHDAITNAVDQVVIVTNDTDISPALRMIRLHTDVTVGVIIPTRNHERTPNTSLTEHAHWVRSHITTQELAASQLPRVISIGKKPTLKPDSWYARPDLLKEVLQLAESILPRRGDVFKWMERTNPFLENQAPINMIETDAGAAKVIAYIHAYIDDKPGNHQPFS